LTAGRPEVPTSRPGRRHLVEIAAGEVRFAINAATNKNSEARLVTRSLSVVSAAAFLLLALHSTSAAAPAPGFVEITPAASGLTASTHDGNTPANAVDNNLGTRWSASGDGVWLKLDLGAAKTVGYVGIAWYKGNARRARFDLQVSNDNVAWTDVLSAAQSGGATTAEEAFDFDDVNARWVRYVGHGNTETGSAQWNSVNEISIFSPAVPTSTPTPLPTSTPTPTATPSPTATPTPPPTPVFVELTPGASGTSASTNDGNVPGNAVDNNLTTRWSANGDGAWLKLDLGAIKTIGYIRAAWWSGNTRTSRFDIEVSTDNTTWQPVLTGALSNGTTTAEQTFELDDVDARWVRYIGHGNSDPTKCCWNSVSELSVWGPLVVTPTPPPTDTPPPTATPTPTNTPTVPTPTPTPRPGQVITLFDGTTLNGWIQVPANSWQVTNGAMASKGVGRGYIYTVGQYSHYRLMFTLRQVSGDHQPCVLIFGFYPPPNYDALRGIQFQPPNGGHWDYREGHNNSGSAYFTRPASTSFSRTQWSRVEMLVNAATGRARMAVAQPVGTRAIENLRFNDPTAGRTGPIAWQMHNSGIKDEFKDVTVEINPTVDDLITTR
jgi:hypothetical protein